MDYDYNYNLLNANTMKNFIIEQLQTKPFGGVVGMLVILIFTLLMILL